MSELAIIEGEVVSDTDDDFETWRAQGAGLAERTREAATQRADMIRRGLVMLDEIARQAWEAEDWRTLGYENWQAYCVGEFGRGEAAIQARQHIVSILRGEGMTHREIAAEVGIARQTVSIDLADVVHAHGQDVVPPGRTGRGHYSRPVQSREERNAKVADWRKTRGELALAQESTTNADDDQAELRKTYQERTGKPNPSCPAPP